MSKKTKQPSPSIPATRDQLEQLLAERARDLATLEQSVAYLEAKIITLREEAQPTITAIQERVDAATKTVKAWAEAHRDEFPPDRKSLELVHATLAFRTSPPAVQLLRGWTEDKAVAHLAAMGVPFERFIRTILEVNREAVLAGADRDKGIFSAVGTEGVDLGLVGLKITQTEKFSIDPRPEVEAQP
jgi:phage host-nuclease inhibitor protein Gam